MMACALHDCEHIEALGMQFSSALFQQPLFAHHVPNFRTFSAYTPCSDDNSLQSAPWIPLHLIAS